MRANNGHIAGLRARVAEWDVLLDGQFGNMVVSICRCAEILSCVGAADGVLNLAEEGRHCHGAVRVSRLLSKAPMEMLS